LTEPICFIREIAWVEENLHTMSAANCRQVHERRFSLTDAVSLEYMRQQGLTNAIVQDEHFARSGISLP
jgi:predicted nucleic acid-binding protein